MISPCKDCQDRKVGCHSVCEKYKAFQESREVALKNKRAYSDANRYMAESIAKRRRRR